MSHITFKRITSAESRIYDAEGDHVGDVFAHDDILNPGKRVYLVWLDEEHVAARDMLRRLWTTRRAVG